MQSEEAAAAAPAAGVAVVRTQKSLLSFFKKAPQPEHHTAGSSGAEQPISPSTPQQCKSSQTEPQSSVKRKRGDEELRVVALSPGSSVAKPSRLVKAVLRKRPGRPRKVEGQEQHSTQSWTADGELG